MTVRSWSVLLVGLLSLSGCGTGSGAKPGTDPVTDPVITQQSPLTVAFASPSGVFHTNKSPVTIQVAVTGAAAERLELLRNGAPFATLPLPHQYLWDCSLDPEGRYEFVARGWYEGKSFDSAPLVVVLDRTSPAVTTPSLQQNARSRGPFRIALSEPIGLPPEGSVVATRSDGLSVPGSVTLGPDGMTVDFVPASPVGAPDLVDVTVAVASDLAGNPLPATKVSFELPVWWAPAGPVGFSSYSASSCGHVALLDSNPFVSWPGYGIAMLESGAWKTSTRPNSTLTRATVASDGASVFLLRSDLVDMNTGHQISLEQLSGLDGTPLASPDPGGNFANPVALAARQGMAPGHELIVAKLVNGAGTGQTLRGARLKNGEWSDMGVIGEPSSSLDDNPSAVFSPSGRPFVALVGNSAGTRSILVRAWSDGAWRDVGSVSVTVPYNYLYRPSLEVSERLVPYVAFVETNMTPDGNANVHVASVDGSSKDLGPVAVVPGNVTRDPSIVLDGAGNPIVAFSEYPSGKPEEAVVWVRRWTGTAWETVGEPLNVAIPTRAARAPSLAIDRQGNMAVAFQEWTGEGNASSGPQRLYVKLLNR